jgi:hypothetical protein
MPESCEPCAIRAAGSASHQYFFLCLGCCCAAVSSARPLRTAQEGMLAAIANNPGAPSRETILAAMRGERVAAAEKAGAAPPVDARPEPREQMTAEAARRVVSERKTKAKGKGLKGQFSGALF